MFEVCKEVRIAAPSDAVWRIITDFPRYSAWTKTIKIEGRPEFGEWLTYVTAARRWAH